MPDSKKTQSKEKPKKYALSESETNPVYLDDASRLMYKIVKLVYMDGMSQRQVVDALKKQGTSISIPSVSRILKKAHDEGIVTYNLKFPKIARMENELRDKLGLLEARVIHLPADSSSQDVTRALGPVAAEYLRELFTVENERDLPKSLGIAGGMTMFRMINSLSQIDEPQYNPAMMESEPLQWKKTSKITLPPSEWNLDIYAISIESFNEWEITSSVNAMLLRQKCKRSRAYSLQLPVSTNAPLQEMQKATEEILSHAAALQMFKKAQEAEVIFTSLGDFSEESRMALASQAVGEDIESLKHKGVVGDINLTAFDKAGKIVDCQFNRRNLGVKGEQLKKLVERNRKNAGVLHRIVTVAGGKNKREALCGALCGGFFNVLITDETCARYLLEQEEFINKTIQSRRES